MARRDVRYRIAAVATCALLGGTQLAPAQTFDLTTPVDWSGPYAAVTFGAVRSGAEADLTDVDGLLLPLDVDLGVLPESVDEFETSGAVGFSAGVNFQNGNFVNGIEAGINFLNQDTTITVSNNGPFPPSGLSVDTHTSYRTEIRNLAAVRWRGGIASGSNFFYVSAGAAAGHVRNEYGFGVSGLPAPLPNPYSAPTASEDGTQWGYVIGIGFERRLADNISLRGELTHFDLADVTLTGRDPTTPGFTQESIEYDFENRGTMAMVGISFSF